jgi:hypothetical protein
VIVISVAIVTAPEIAAGADGGGFEIENAGRALDALVEEAVVVVAPGAGFADEPVVEVVHEAAVAFSLLASEALTVYSPLNPYRYEVLGERSDRDVFEENRH